MSTCIIFMTRGYEKKLLRVAPPNFFSDPFVMEKIPTKLNKLQIESKTKKQPAVTAPTLYLEGGYEPSDHDILCGRSRESSHHVGNRYLRTLVALHLKRYIVGNRTAKSQLAKEVVSSIRESGGKFIKFDEEQNLWFEIGDKGARSKVAHSFRDSLAHVRESLPNTNSSNNNNASPKATAAVAKREREWSTVQSTSTVDNYDAKMKPRGQSLKSPPGKSEQDDDRDHLSASLTQTTKVAAMPSTTETAANAKTTTIVENPLDVLVKALDFQRKRDSSSNTSEDSNY